ncbi:MAG: hypothetical protein N3D75_04125 [Candidatus Aenigmarchaeota archaeon]|nr:hypothetical protein [Candidatus Aenigmarchaeota archaeon]
MKAQTQVVSVILVVGIALAAVATITPWSLNMIQKRKDAKAVEDVFNFFFLLDSKIREVAVNGGEQTLMIKVPGKISVYPYRDDQATSNNITFSFTSKVSNVALNEWISFTSNKNKTATLGVDSFGVIQARAQRQRDYMKMDYNLWYRDLLDRQANRLYRIKLSTMNDQVVHSTNGFIRIQRGEITTAQGLTITEVKIII